MYAQGIAAHTPINPITLGEPKFEAILGCTVRPYHKRDLGDMAQW